MHTEKKFRENGKSWRTFVGGDLMSNINIIGKSIYSGLYNIINFFKISTQNKSYEGKHRSR